MCVFCDIIRGDIPSYKVYEDENYLAILDISQVTFGHTLVMPKKHCETILDMKDDEAGELMKVANKVAKKIIKNLNATGCNMIVNTGEVAGQSVKHAHLHIVPRYTESDSIKIEFKENKFNLDEVLNRINKGL